MQLPFSHQTHSVQKLTYYDTGVKLFLKVFSFIRSYAQLSHLKPEFSYTLILYEIDRQILYFIELYIHMGIEIHK